MRWCVERREERTARVSSGDAEARVLVDCAASSREETREDKGIGDWDWVWTLAGIMGESRVWGLLWNRTSIVELQTGSEISRRNGEPMRVRIFL